jgi:hypothetical protein
MMRAGSGQHSTPHWGPTPAAELLQSLTHETGVVGRDCRKLFLSACEADAALHGGYVSVNRVRQRLSDAGADIPPRKYSAMWSAYTGRGKPMVKVQEWERCSGSGSRNDGRPFPMRRWVGWPDQQRG